MKFTENITEIILHDERKIFGKDGYQYLIHLENERRYRQGPVGMPDLRTLPIRFNKRFNVERDVPVLQRFDGFRVNDGSSVIGKFNGVQVGEFRNQLRLVEP